MLRLFVSTLVSLTLFSHCLAEEVPLQPSREDTPRGSINFMCFSPDGSTFATCSSDMKIRLWNPETCELLGVLEPPNDERKLELRGVAFSPDGKQVAAMQRFRKPRSKELMLLLWDGVKQSFLKRLSTAEHYGTSGLSDIAFSPDGRSVWICEGSTAHGWNLASGAVSSHPVDKMLHGRLRFRTNTDPMLIFGMAKLSVTDPRSGTRYFHFANETLVWGDISKSGERFLAYNQKGELLVGDTQSGKILNRFRPRHGGVGWMHRMHDEEDSLLVFTTTGHVERWDWKNARCTGQLPEPLGVHNFHLNVTLKYGRPGAWMFRVYFPTPIALSPDDSKLAVLAGYQFAMLPLDWQEPE